MAAVRLATSSRQDLRHARHSGPVTDATLAKLMAALDSMLSADATCVVAVVNGWGKRSVKRRAMRK